MISQEPGEVVVAVVLVVLGGGPAAVSLRTFLSVPLCVCVAG